MTSRHHPRGARPPPGPASTPDAVPPADPVPREVRLSFWLWMTSIALAVVAGVSGLVQGWTIAARLRAAAGDVEGGASTASGLATVLVLGALTGALSVLLYVVFGLAMLRGRHWARVGLCVLGGLAVLSAGYRLATASIVTVDGEAVATTSTLARVLAPVQCLVIVAAVVLLFRPPASAFFRLASARRTRRPGHGAREPTAR